MGGGCFGCKREDVREKRSGGTVGERNIRERRERTKYISMASQTSLLFKI